MFKKGLKCLKCLESDDGVGVDDIGDGLHFFADKMADIDAVIDMEFGQNIKMTGNGINFRSDFSVCQAACDIIGLRLSLSALR